MNIYAVGSPIRRDELAKIITDRNVFLAITTTGGKWSALKDLYEFDDLYFESYEPDKTLKFKFKNKRLDGILEFNAIDYDILWKAYTAITQPKKEYKYPAQFTFSLAAYGKESEKIE